MKYRIVDTRDTNAPVTQHNHVIVRNDEGINCRSGVAWGKITQRNISKKAASEIIHSLPAGNWIDAMVQSL